MIFTATWITRKANVQPTVLFVLVQNQSPNLAISASQVRRKFGQHRFGQSKVPLRGNHLSNATCLTHAFFKVANNAADSTSRVRQVMP